MKTHKKYSKMFKLLVVFFIIIDVGEIKCQINRNDEGDGFIPRQKKYYYYRQKADPYEFGCPPGTEIDVTTGECIVTGGGRDADFAEFVNFVIGCPPGTIRDARGICVSIAERKETDQDVFESGCPPGTKIDVITGECVRNENRQDADPDVSRTLCPPGTARHATSGECVEVISRRYADISRRGCPPGTVRDAVLGDCVVIVRRRIESSRRDNYHNKQSASVIAVIIISRASFYIFVSEL